MPINDKITKASPLTKAQRAAIASASQGGITKAPTRKKTAVKTKNRGK